MRLSGFALGILATLSLPACGSSSGGTTTPTAPVAPPTGSFVVAPDGQAISGVTAMTFTATGTDPQGSALTFSWQFGDGQTASGQAVTHVFAADGSYNVVLSIRNSGGGTATPSATVVARSLTGHWVDADPRYQMELKQDGSNLTGTVSFAGIGIVGNIQSGAISNPRNVAFTRVTLDFRFYQGDYTGTVGSSLNTMALASGTRSTFNLTRQ